VSKGERMKVGDRVTCALPVKAYYSDAMFRPGDVGTVASIAPKVCKVKGPGYDGRDHFLVVDFEDPIHGKQRCSLNYCNAVQRNE